MPSQSNSGCGCRASAADLGSSKCRIVAESLGLSQSLASTVSSGGFSPCPQPEGGNGGCASRRLPVSDIRPLPSRSPNQTGRGDHGGLDLQGPGPQAGARPAGDAGPEPPAPGAAAAGAEPRAPALAAVALPPGVPRLARRGGRPGPVAAGAGPGRQRRGPRLADAGPPLPAPGPRGRALPAGPVLCAETDRTQPHQQPLRPRNPNASVSLVLRVPPREPCLYFAEGLRKWMVQHGGDGWVVEKNMKAVPGAPSQTCFVTSFSWCRKKQVVDLEEKGLWPELLDSGGVEIAVSDWWGARHDSGCKYRLLVKLLDAHQNVLDKFSAVPDPIEQWNNNIYLQYLSLNEELIDWPE
ncbi:F-box only protein 27 isoform X3 [Mesocricetus auratus]|uniref:F-box only protein 27 isoform X3 n=1 Tax=Mesocricetus auratus TaxID=10036 RepID=A0ABM2WJ40_MESAU|nr:F-box only protein 27 isoform X3 [Mesocricetus auratus]